jgi:hypothetical protein
MKAGALFFLCFIILAGLVGVWNMTRVSAQDCIPTILEVHDTYPQSVNPNQEVAITTTVTVSCIVLGYVTKVDIMPTGYTRILTTASGPIAINRLTAPGNNGPWSLDILASLIDYPYGRVLSSKRDTIVIQVGAGSTSTGEISTQYSTATMKSTSTITATPVTRTTIETHTMSSFILPQDQTIAPIAIVFAVLFVISAGILLRARRGQT